MLASLTVPPALRGVAAFALPLIGLLLLTFGWRIYRTVLVMCAVIIGGLAAAALARGHGVVLMLAVGLPVGALCGRVALHFERYAVFVIGGVAGALPVLNSYAFFYTNHTMYAVALGAFLIIGSLTVLFWKPAIVFSISAIGAALVEKGLLMIADRLRPGLGYHLIANQNLALCGLFLLLTLVGVALQYRDSRQEERPTGGPEALREGNGAHGS